MNYFSLLTVTTCFIGSVFCSSVQASQDNVSDLGHKIQATSASPLAPDFKIPRLSSNTSAPKNPWVRLSDYKGKWLFVNFWASWCTPCRKELPILQALYEKYRHANIEMVAISIDEDASEALDALKNVTLDFSLALDSNNRVSQDYQVSAMPTSYLINPEGKIVKAFYGFKKGYKEKYNAIFKTIAQL